jgi:hypothetical protein
LLRFAKSSYICRKEGSASPMERSFSKEVEALRLGAGETFRGEGILAVTKALLQSGVSYVGGYQGATVSHLLDVMVRKSTRRSARKSRRKTSRPKSARRASRGRQRG